MKTITAIEAVNLLQTKWGLKREFDSPKAFFDAVSTQDKRKARQFFPELKCYAYAWEAWDPCNPLQPSVTFDRRALSEVNALFEKGVDLWNNNGEYEDLAALATETKGDRLQFWTNLQEDRFDLYTFIKALCDIAKKTQTTIDICVENTECPDYSIRIATDGTISEQTGAQKLSTENQDDFMFALTYSMEKFLLSSFEEMDEIGFRFAVEE